jgi:hypothetical protein
MKILILVFALVPGYALAQCSIAITSPTNNTTVSGPITLSATTTNCPSTVRFEWRMYNQPLVGDGTYEYSYSIPVCTGGTCVSSYSMINGFGPYNVSYNWDGVYPLTVEAIDAAGTVLATSPAITITVNDTGFGTCSLTSPNLSVPQSGTINITVDCSGLSGIPSNTVYSDAWYLFYVDGQLMGSFMESGYPTQALSFDTTTLENRTDHYVYVAIASSSNQTTFGLTPFAGAFGIMSTSNGSHARELRCNHSTSYLWLGGVATDSLACRTVNDDNTEGATNATFTSDTPSVVTTTGCNLVTSCTITGVALGASNGVATITATAASGLSTTIRVSVQNGIPIFPHLGYDGSLCTQYNQGNCTTGKSQLGRSLFDANSSTTTNSVLRSSMLNMAYNLPQIGIYPNPADIGYPTFLTWKNFYWSSQYLPKINTVLGSFRSFIAQCNSMGATGQELQSSSDGNGAASDGAGFAARASFMLGTILGKINFCVNGDENSLPFIKNFGTGGMGSPEGPSNLVVNGGIITINGINVTRFFPTDITGAASTCLNVAKITVSGNGPYTIPNTNGCPNGTYTDPTLVIQLYNEMDVCAAVNGCQNTLLHIRVPNSVFKTITNTLLSSPVPVQIDLPLQGSAPKSSYQIATTLTGISAIYWDYDGPENQAEARGYPNSRLTRATLLSMENHFWTQAWPGVDHTKPFYLLTQGNGEWFARGGKTFTLGATTGSQLTTTVPNNAVIGAKINVTGASCGLQFMDVLSIQSSSTFTVSQIPACIGSGGTVVIASTNRYFTPPMDRLKFPELRGVDIAAQQWDAIALGAFAQRLFNYFPSSPTQFNNYPASAIQAYTGASVNGQSFEDNNTALIEDFSKNPSAQERWYAAGISQIIMRGLEPQLIQPSCNAPGLGSRFHTGAKCGAGGKLVISINDSNTPGTLSFPTSLWSTYTSGAGPITRLRFILAAYTDTINLVSSSTSDSFVAQPGEVDIWWFPTTSASLVQPVTIITNPSSVGASQTALRYSYLCDPIALTSNLEQQPSRIIFGSAIILLIDTTIGPVCYDTLYLNGANVPVGATSGVQVLTGGGVRISGNVTLNGNVVIH